MAVEYQTELDAVREAIIAVTSGNQQYTINMPGGGSRSFTKASLPELYKRENALLALLDRQKRGGMKVTYVR